MTARWLAGTALLLVGAGAAHAAAPAFNWTGFYVGVQGGASGVTSTENYNPAYSTPYDPYYWAPSGTGFSGGFFAGYYLPINQMFVLGLEGEVNADNATAWYYGDKEVVQNWDAALKAKFGMPLGNTLVYGLAGVAVSHFDYSDYWSSSSYGGTVFTDVGGQLGIGIQTQLTDNVFGRVEVAGTWYSKHTIDYLAAPYWDVMPSSVTVKGGIGINLGGRAGADAITAPTQAAYNWTGFYFGVQGGLAGLSSTENYNPDYTTPEEPYAYSMTSHGATGGFFAGYNTKINDMFVLGVEGEVNADNAVIWYDTYKNTVQTWDAALKAKFGMPMGNTLVYGLAGLAVSHFDYSDYWSGYPGANFNDVGGQIGLGVQTQFTDQMFGRLEIAQTFYGKQTFNSGGSPYWDVWPSNVTIKAGVGVNFP